VKRNINQHRSQIAGNKILIVTEGKNTEPIYFNELSRFYAKIKGLIGVYSQGNPNICEMLSFARKKLKSTRSKGIMSPLQYEKAYILIDRDHFANEPNGISRLAEVIQSIKPNEKIEVILSSPCFEFWFFLHFLKESPSDTNVILSKLENELKRARIIPSNSRYSKDKRFASHFMQKLVRMGRLYSACENSVWVNKQSLEKDFWNKHPHTNVHEIIKGLGLWNT